jgi:hypothetical protein
MRKLRLVVAALVLLQSTVSFAADTKGATRLSLVVGEQMSVSVQNDVLQLKIRLAPEVSASIWTAENCSAPSDQAMLIQKSGIYNLPLNSFAPDAKACVLSSDGVLVASVPLSK